MKYYRNFLTTQWAAPLNFPVTWQWPITFSTSLSMSFSQIQQVLLKWNCLLFFFTHDQIFVKMFFGYFFAVFKLFKNRFNKFIRSIFASKKNYWFSKFIINTNKFVSKTTRNVILILFWVRAFKTFNTFELHSKSA